MRELLADDGSIFVHLDKEMVFHVKLIMDEIFGSGNFKTIIARKKCHPKGTTRKNFGNIQDHILFYTKTIKIKSFTTIYYLYTSTRGCKKIKNEL